MIMKLKCPHCEHEFEDVLVDGQTSGGETGSAECPSCGEAFNWPVEEQHEPDDSMDGDAASALASAGLGTDEDYGGGTHDWEEGGFGGED
jgi:transcription elongation factor Elf1